MSYNPESIVSQIQEAYPNPVAIKEVPKKAGAYCVGGAVMHFFGFRTGGFCNPYELQRALQQINPQLPADRARGFAGRIMTENDNSRFQNSWKTVHKALTEGG